MESWIGPFLKKIHVQEEKQPSKQQLSHALNV